MVAFWNVGMSLVMDQNKINCHKTWQSLGISNHMVIACNIQPTNKLDIQSFQNWVIQALKINFSRVINGNWRSMGDRRNVIIIGGQLFKGVLNHYLTGVVVVAQQHHWGWLHITVPMESVANVAGGSIKWW